jgi:uncharacterized phage-associated protein
MYSAGSIANYFLDLADAECEKLDPIKLQKLVYYAVGWHAGYTGARLIDEEVKAWPSGPIIASLYYAFIDFGLDPITGRARENLVVVPVPDSPDVQSFLRNVWNAYRGFTTRKMSEMSHALDTPWDKTVQNSHGVQNMTIDFELIRAHFAKAVEKVARESDLLNGGPK